MTSEQIVRFIGKREKTLRLPIYAVWELTLQCNLKCTHCGSRAGEKRKEELTSAQAFGLVDQLAALGVRELALIGGEAYLRSDWLEVVSKARSAGMKVVLQTGGFGFSKKLAARALKAGLSGIGVSIDGIEEVHDQVRGVTGSYREALAALNAAQEVGLSTTVNTQIHSLNFKQLPIIYDKLKIKQVKAWQLQLTVAMGNAVENSSLLLQPFQLDEIFDDMAIICDRSLKDDISFIAGNNIGYFGPYEHLWRGPNQAHDHYEGCYAGINGLGIEADGTIKGCPSLSTERYAEGNIKNKPLEQIWTDSKNFSLNQTGTQNLWGFCKTCYYSNVCRGGCAWTSDSLLGKPGNNPYCHHRVIELKSKGLRERVVKIEEASSKSFGTGLFDLIEEPWPI